MSQLSTNFSFRINGERELPGKYSPAGSVKTWSQHYGGVSATSHAQGLHLTAMLSAGIDARNGAPERRFDAYPWRHPVTESNYINSLANHPYRSTIKTLPATLPEPSF